MKIAIVTGASSGMGRETVLELAESFSGLDQIWAVARRKERLDQLARRCGDKVLPLALDLMDEQDLGRLVHLLEKTAPQVRILVNAAGYGRAGRIGELRLADELGMIALDCGSLAAVTHLVLPYMPKNSRILQFASAAAFMPQPGFAVYAAAKAFVLSYSRALGAELGSRRICVTAVCPGPVRTEFFDGAGSLDDLPVYKRLAMANPKKVVRQALLDMRLGRPVSVYGVPMKAFHLLCGLLPQDLLVAVLAAMQRAS